MSKSRAPSFSKAESAACSRKMSATPVQAKASPKPRRRATWLRIHQSCRASPGAGRNGRWREMPRSELVTVPSFSAQASAGRRMRQASTVSVARIASETIEYSQCRERIAHGVGVGQAGDRIGRHDPDRLDLAAPDRLEQVDRLEAGLRRHARRAPEAADAIDIGRREIHVRGERVGQRADLAAAHRVGLAGDRERAHARPADAAGQQMAVDQRVDLVDAGARLVDALRIERDRLLGAREPVEEGRDVDGRQVAVGGVARLRGGQRGLQAGRVPLDEVARDRAAPLQRPPAGR